MRKQLLLLIFLSISFIGFSQKKYLQCGQVLDIENEQYLLEKTIVVANDSIVDILDGFIDPVDEKDFVIDLRTKTILPGFIDMHVHLENSPSKNSYLERFTWNDADIAFRAYQNGKKTLMAGFTTVRDLGGTGVNTSLRNAIYNGTVEGPRIFSAGKAIGSTGGHADPTNGFKKSLQGDPGPKEGVVNGPTDARKAVRQRYKEGADLIKVTATGGVLSLAKSGTNPQFTLEELKTIVKTAKDYKMMVAAHAHGDEGMQRAILAGVTTIEHATFMSDTTMILMKAKGTYLVPTLTAAVAVTEYGKQDGFYPEVVVPKALKVGPQIQRTFELAHRRNLNIAFGTDAGVFPHGENAKEFALMVEGGMTIMEAIKCATIINANLLGEKRIGRIEKGAYADIIAVDENPMLNNKTLENIIFVMKNGKVYKSEL
ncbi:metal-dependent hydrolase family protein [Aureivirga sp. CE67]|uniref:metal-dependent hydrolase family protein n=1 Tax=Aureivirga sp. CE67 TaxID=1788983 RepID=UPI0018CA01EF|nr:amidohydrolase family protein [Aureivirga sp. CE67]